jgi:nucleotidyltransferase substrate binding protein (TIGR01987 family)
MTKDIRWQQRFSNYELALSELTDAVTLSKQRKLSKLEAQGLIQSFEYNYELAWNCLKDFFEYQAEEKILGSRDAIRLAFKRGLIENGEVWMQMIEDRISTTHTYNKALAEKIAKKIIEIFYPEFLRLHKTLSEMKNKK